MKNFYTLQFQVACVATVVASRYNDTQRAVGITRHTSFVWLELIVAVAAVVRRWNETSKVGVRALVVAKEK